jgi:hypothetical protein
MIAESKEKMGNAQGKFSGGRIRLSPTVTGRITSCTTVGTSTISTVLVLCSVTSAMTSPIPNSPQPHAIGIAVSVQ